MQEEWKRLAASAAAEFVEPGMIVGLGSGTTMAEVVRFLAERKVKAKFIPSSDSIAKLARGLGLEICELNENIDLVIDGADEVNPSLDMIKGKGGALTREKILARIAEKVVIAVDRTKLVRKLGERSPVPVEVLPFSSSFAAKRLERLGGRPSLRMSGGSPYLTDNGNYILDVRFGAISRPETLERKLNEIPGVIENGIFVGLADEVIVGYEGGYELLRNRKEFLRFLRHNKL